MIGNDSERCGECADEHEEYSAGISFVTSLRLADTVESSSVLLYPCVGQDDVRHIVSADSGLQPWKVPFMGSHVTLGSNGASAI
jgi:hypothetical protein